MSVSNVGRTLSRPFYLLDIGSMVEIRDSREREGGTGATRERTTRLFVC